MRTRGALMTTAVLVAALAGGAGTAAAAGGGPTVTTGGGTETFADDFILDLCGIETETTVTERWTHKQFRDGSETLHVVRTFVSADPRLPVEKGAATSFIAPDGIPRPALSAGGTLLSFGGAGLATLVRTADGGVTEVSIPGGRDHHVAVSPDGRTVAYAEDNQVDAVELTLRRLDDTPPTTVRVTASAAAGALVPVVWSDEGSSLLVLDGNGATRVDLRPGPRAGRGVYAQTDLVLANGWAAAPDLSRFVMSDAAPLAGGQRRWLVLDSDDARRTEALNRPADDRLIGWTAGDRLVWWHRTADGYSVVTSDTAGRSLRTELRLPSELPNLTATWSEDQG